MITLDEACKNAYEKKERFNAVFELGIDQVFDRLSYWTIGFDYIDPESHKSPYALQLAGTGLCLCIDKNTGKEVSGEDFSIIDVLTDNIPGHEVPVPDEFYRVPWYEFEE